MLMDASIQGMQKRKEKKRKEKKYGSGRFMVKTSLSIHMSKISKGHEKIDSESLRSLFK